MTILQDAKLFHEELHGATVVVFLVVIGPSFSPLQVVIAVERGEGGGDLVFAVPSLCLFQHQLVLQVALVHFPRHHLEMSFFADGVNVMNNHEILLFGSFETGTRLLPIFLRFDAKLPTLGLPGLVPKRTVDDGSLLHDVQHHVVVIAHDGWMFLFHMELIQSVVEIFLNFGEERLSLFHVVVLFRAFGKPVDFLQLEDDGENSGIFGPFDSGQHGVSEGEKALSILLLHPVLEIPKGADDTRLVDFAEEARPEKTPPEFVLHKVLAVGQKHQRKSMKNEPR